MSASQRRSVSRSAASRWRRALRTDRHAAIAQRGDELLRVFQLVFDQEEADDRVLWHLCQPLLFNDLRQRLETIPEVQAGKPSSHGGLARLAGKFPYQPGHQV